MSEQHWRFVPGSESLPEAIEVAVDRNGAACACRSAMLQIPRMKLRDACEEPVKRVLVKGVPEPAQKQQSRPRQWNLAERNAKRKLKERHAARIAEAKESAFDFAAALRQILGDDQQPLVGFRCEMLVTPPGAGLKLGLAVASGVEVLCAAGPSGCNCCHEPHASKSWRCVGSTRSKPAMRSGGRGEESSCRSKISSSGKRLRVLIPLRAHCSSKSASHLLNAPASRSQLTRDDARRNRGA